MRAWEKDLKPDRSENISKSSTSTASQRAYGAGRLNHPRPVAQSGYKPPKQSAIPSAMVYAVAMATDRPFRGRLWTRRPVGAELATIDGKRTSRCRATPASLSDALREPTPTTAREMPLLFAIPRHSGQRRGTAGGLVFNCCRTTSWARDHAPLIDGCIPDTRSHGRRKCWLSTRRSPTSVAVQHFTMPAVLRAGFAKPGACRLSRKLADIAVQFGDAIAARERCAARSPRPEGRRLQTIKRAHARRRSPGRCRLAPSPAL